MTYQCEKGCKDPKAKEGRPWHRSVNECPYETYNPKAPQGRPGFRKAQGTPAEGAAPAQAPAPSLAPASPPPARPAPPQGGAAGITLSGRRADVVKGATAPERPVITDYMVDWPHTEALWNFGFRVLYFVHVKVDEWVFDWKQHLPREQFKLSDNAKAAAEVDPRNIYARGATWLCRTVLRCPDQKAAHSAIDSIVFLEAFGGVFVALIFHYEKVYKESPKLKAKREEKRLRAEAMKRARLGQMDTTARVVNPPAAAEVAA